MPPVLPLTSERMERHGLFMIEDGQTIFLWVGRDAVPQLIMDVFNLPSYEVLRGGKVRLYYRHEPACLPVSCTDNSPCARQSLLAARERGDSEDEGDASGAVSPTSVCGEGGRRATTATVGAECADPGQGRCIAELPAVYSAVEGQG
jgi:hypothetical protein